MLFSSWRDNVDVHSTVFWPRHQSSVLRGSALTRHIYLLGICVLTEPGTGSHKYWSCRWHALAYASLWNCCSHVIEDSRLGSDSAANAVRLSNRIACPCASLNLHQGRAQRPFHVCVSLDHYNVLLLARIARSRACPALQLSFCSRLR